MSDKQRTPVDILLGEITESMFFLDGFYVGHKTLLRKLGKEIEMVNFLTEDGKPSFPRIQSVAIYGWQRAYLEVQKILAKKYLVGKRVSIKGGIVKSNFFHRLHYFPVTSVRKPNVEEQKKVVVWCCLAVWEQGMKFL